MKKKKMFYYVLLIVAPICVIVRIILLTLKFNLFCSIKSIIIYLFILMLLS